MKNTVKYFDTVTGNEIDAARALDRHGVLKDGYTLRVPLTMRDSTAGRARFVDGSGTPLNLTAGNRPGYRIPVNDGRRQVVVDDAYRRYEAGLIRAHRVVDGVQCPDCFGSGEDEDGEDCPFCDGTGVMPEQTTRTSKGGGKGFGSGNEGGYDTPDPASDSRQVMDHRQRMSELYDAHDRELANAWRQP